jgi:hypothetical protein
MVQIFVRFVTSVTSVSTTNLRYSQIGESNAYMRRGNIECNTPPLPRTGTPDLRRPAQSRHYHLVESVQNKGASARFLCVGGTDHFTDIGH